MNAGGVCVISSCGKTVLNKLLWCLVCMFPVKMLRRLALNYALTLFRRSYMVLAGLIGASGWFYLANFANSPFEATAASIVASLGVAISDVVADSIVVEKVRLKIC